MAGCKCQAIHAFFRKADSFCRVFFFTEVWFDRDVPGANSGLQAEVSP